MTVLQKLNAIYPQPPGQDEIGHIPAAYICAAAALCESGPLKESAEQILADPKHAWRKTLGRDDVSRICRDTQVDPLVAFCCCMAWGLQWSASGFDSFHRALRNSERLSLELQSLRDGTESRQNAFLNFSKPKLGKIDGLEFAYFTKLLYFFMPADKRGYIFDQWTAKSVYRLNPNIGIRFPANDPRKYPSKPSAEVYEQYCAYIEELANALKQPWTPDKVEIALFKWRE